VIRSTISLLTLLVLGGWVGSALATPVVTTQACVNDTSFQCVSGISDLVVETDTFDVSFVQGSYNSIFSSVSPYYLGDDIGASRAGSAIASIFNSNSPTMLWNAGQAVYSLAIPYSFDATSDTFSMNFTASIDSGAMYLSQNTGGGIDANADTSAGLYEGFAVFKLQTRSGVPAPATFGLFFLALVSLGWTRRAES